MVRVVSGMRPTGKLNIGHYFGVIQNWVELQKENEMFLFSADWHAMTTKFDESYDMRFAIIDNIKDWIACGIDPDQVALFVQSDIKQHSELYLILNMITPVSWLERNPAYKDLMAQEEYKDKNNAGFLTYPVLQAADIVMYGADIVPIGEDQRPHLELTREIVRRFHYIYKNELFKEPKEVMTEISKLSGLDGRKMSKSFNNSILLDEEEKEIWQKVRNAKTDTNRIKKTDPGNPDLCIVWEYHAIFSGQPLKEEINAACRTGSIGCVECKKKCAANIEAFIAPKREKKGTLSDEMISDILLTGAKKANALAKEKMEKVNEIVLKGLS